MMPSIPQLLIVLVIVVLIFGAKRLRNLGGDLGSAVKGFKDAVKENPEDEADQAQIEGATKMESVAEETAEAVESVNDNKQA